MVPAAAAAPTATAAVTNPSVVAGTLPAAAGTLSATAMVPVAAPTATAAVATPSVIAGTLPAAASTLSAAAAPINAIDPSAATAAAAAVAADAAIAAAPAVVAASGEENDRATLVSTQPDADPVAAATPASSGTSAAADPLPTDSIAQANPAVAPPTTVHGSRHARTPAPCHNSCSAGRVLPDSSATGIWLLLEDAAAYLSVPYQSDRQFRKSSELNTSRHIERGASVSAATPFSSFDYVCVLKDAPPGWRASANTRLKLPEFLRLCSHLSINLTSIFPPGSEIALNFSRYTGRTFTPRNVRAAFDDRVLYSSQFLNDKLKVGLQLGKRKCQGIRHPRVDSYAPLHPDWCTQVGVQQRRNAYHHVLCGRCENDAVGKDNRSTQCRSFYTNITRHRHPELFNESATPTLPQFSPISNDNTVEKIRSDIIEIRELCVVENSGTLGNSRLQDSAALLFQRGIYLLDLGNRMQFRVCAVCSAHDFVKARKDAAHLCRKCQAKKWKRKQNEKRRIEHRELRVDPKSHVPMSSLSPDELIIRARKANNSRRNVRKYINRMEKKIAGAQVELEISEEPFSQLEDQPIGSAATKRRRPK